MPLSDVEKRVLMELQYRFPFREPDPYAAAAEKLGMSVEELLDVLRGLRERGVLKRVGFYVNPRARRRSVALIAFLGGSVEEAARLCAGDEEVTHCYERVGGGDWRVWVVRRAGSMEELLTWAERFAASIGAVRFEILAARRVHRLSVKYDLYRGVSRAGPYTRVALNPPSPEELGIDPRLPKLLHSLPLEPDPYGAVAEKLGLSREEVPRLVERMLEAGILGDPGAVLDGHRAGFRVNAMLVAKPEAGLEELCERVVEEVPEATHIVERLPYPPDTVATWAPTCYAMVHAVDEEKVKPVIERMKRLPGVAELHALYSTRDLKPGAER